MKTHKVLDLHYTPEEGQDDFVGTLEECQEYIGKQTVSFMYNITPLTTIELNFYKNRNEN